MRFLSMWESWERRSEHLVGEQVGEHYLNGTVRKRNVKEAG